MLRVRYFTETLASDENPHNHETQRSKLHFHSRKCLWARLDNTTIIGVAEIEDHHFEKLVNGHPTVTIHPSLYETVKMKDHFDKHNKLEHFATLQNVADVTINDTCADVIAKLVQKGLTFLSPER